eukprot:TRINITY_DN7851_c0_g2_i1.p1 TRINITY_DN7851_c0_g2~~TRINITY_DN7851_c0_g2_i1.p1  ORF type:complete len:417 (+),score=34.10 TRINITY_DN7851_c0_g2_i1:107-1357(+)
MMGRPTSRSFQLIVAVLVTWSTVHGAGDQESASCADARDKFDASELLQRTVSRGTAGRSSHESARHGPSPLAASATAGSTVREARSPNAATAALVVPSVVHEKGSAGFNASELNGSSSVGPPVSHGGLPRHVSNRSSSDAAPDLETNVSRWVDAHPETSESSKSWTWTLPANQMVRQLFFVQSESKNVLLSDPNLLMFFIVTMLIVVVLVVCSVSCCLWRHGFIDLPFFPGAQVFNILKGYPDKADEGHMIKGKWMVGCESMPPGGGYKFFSFNSEAEALEFYKVQAFLSRIMFDNNHYEIMHTGPNVIALNAIRRRSKEANPKPVRGAWNVALSSPTYGKCDFYAFSTEEDASKYLGTFCFVPGLLFNPELQEVKSVGNNFLAHQFIRRRVAQSVEKRARGGERGSHVQQRNVCC